MEHYFFGEDGRVYNAIYPSTHIPYLSNIYDIACGESHNLFITTEGLVYSMGTGDLGQLGNGKNVSTSNPVIVLMEEGSFLSNIYKVSAGNKTSMAVTMDGKVYEWGNNTKTLYPKELTKTVSIEGNDLSLEKMKIVEARKYTFRNSRYGWICIYDGTKHRWTARYNR
ncbi:MAG: hypothetical protein K2H53_05455 [Clostridia bacterium]|nr:hypothetical protein [Clostridia bacterium]